MAEALSETSFCRWKSIVEGGVACENQKMIEQLQTADMESMAQRQVLPPAKGGALLATVAYASTVFLSAFLLFHVQLIVGKYILPLFRGAPSVWNTCMLFFQVILLVGYAYSHLHASRFHVRAQALIHADLLIVALT